MTKFIAFIDRHGVWMCILAAVVTAGSIAFVNEHNTRLQADAKVKAAQAEIVDLQKQQSAVREAATAKVVILRKQAATVDTPEKAVAALIAPTPEEKAVPVEAAPLAVSVIPDAPGRVAVDALPLYQTVNACRQDVVQLNACTQELSLEKAISGKKDEQITTLKGKPSFWHRVGHAAKVTGCAALGGAVGGYFKSTEGAAIGAAAGAGACQMF